MDPQYVLYECFVNASPRAGDMEVECMKLHEPGNRNRIRFPAPHSKIIAVPRLESAEHWIRRIFQPVVKLTDPSMSVNTDN